MHPTLNIAFRAVRLAAENINRSLERSDNIIITEKSPNNYVTSVDTHCEEIIIESLQQSFPDAGFICEESGKTNADSDMVWIIDPIDGTHNFIHNFPYFCISIGCQINGKLEHGLIFNPITQDVYFASKGKGAQKNDKNLRISKNKKIKEALILHQASLNIVKSPEYIKSIIKIKENAAGVRLTGSTALDMAHVSSGQGDLFFTHSPKIWDYAAGAVIAREAGAMITDIKGGIDFGEKNGLIMGDPKLVASLVKLLKN